MARRAGTERRISERPSAGSGGRACFSKSRLLLWSMAARVLPKSGVTRPARGGRRHYGLVSGSFGRTAGFAESRDLERHVLGRDVLRRQGEKHALVLVA